MPVMGSQRGAHWRRSQPMRSRQCCDWRVPPRQKRGADGHSSCLCLRLASGVCAAPARAEAISSILHCECLGRPRAGHKEKGLPELV